MQIPWDVHASIYNSGLGINYGAVKATDFLLCSDLESLGGRGVGLGSQQNYRAQ